MIPSACRWRRRGHVKHEPVLVFNEKLQHPLANIVFSWREDVLWVVNKAGTENDRKVWRDAVKAGLAQTRCIHVLVAVIRLMSDFRANTDSRSRT